MQSDTKVTVPFVIKGSVTFGKLHKDENLISIRKTPHD